MSSAQEFRPQPTFVFPRSCDEKSVWKGRFEDFMISSCKRVDPFASTTLFALDFFVSKLHGEDFLHEVFLLQPLKRRRDIWPPSTLILLQPSSHLMLDQTLPLCSCQARTSLILTPSSHCAGVTPLASNSQFSTRRCVTSISSTG